MKKKIGFAIAISFLMAFSYAQDYSTGIGARGGLYNGLTIKHFISQKSALEGIVSTRWAGFKVTGLYEIHGNAFDVPRLNYYYGFGAHVGFWDGSNIPNSTINGQYIGIGADGILGLEYNFEEIPINLSVDWKPSFDIFGDSRFYGDAGAISIRYIF